MNKLAELKKKEKMYFDTYKQKRNNLDKAIHLEEMAKVIREIDKLENPSGENKSNYEKMIEGLNNKGKIKSFSAEEHIEICRELNK